MPSVVLQAMEHAFSFRLSIVRMPSYLIYI